MPTDINKMDYAADLKKSLLKGRMDADRAAYDKAMRAVLTLCLMAACVGVGVLFAQSRDEFLNAQKVEAMARDCESRHGPGTVLAYLPAKRELGCVRVK